MDKRFYGVSVADAEKKRQRDQALTAKEFAVLSGLSYKVARCLFQTPGFPVHHRYVFWSDFLLWRRAHAGNPADPALSGGAIPATAEAPASKNVPAKRARARILASV